MDVTCSHCNTEYEFDDALVSDAGTSVRCTQCGHRFKVRRREGSAAPEVWIVRTVEGHTLEFRALRELKVAIGNKKVGRDDVLSRGSGRPRRLASIAELEPFFSQPGDPGAKARNSRESSGARSRALTPSGLGPADPRGSHFDLAAFVPKKDGPTSVNVPPPTPSVSSRETNPFLDEDEVTRSRQFTRELRQLGDGPPSVEPKTEPEPARFRDPNGPRTILGVPQLAPPAVPSDLATTKAFGTPVEARSAPAPVIPPEHDRRQPTLVGLEAAAEAALTELAESRPTEPVQAALMAALLVESQPEPPTRPRQNVEPTPNPSPVYAGAAAPPKPTPPPKAPLPTPKPPPAAKLPPPPAAKLPPPPAPAPAPAASEPPVVKASTPAPKAVTPAPKAATPAPKAPSKPAPAPPPAPEPANEAGAEPPASAGRPNVLPPAPVGATAVQLQDEPPLIQEAPRSVGPRGGRASAVTPTPASEIRYSLADDPDARPTSASGSRRATSSSMRLIVALLVGGSLIFVGILLVNRFVRRGNVEAGSQNANVDELLAAYEKALAAGDLSSAGDKANEASRLADAEPRVAKAVAKVAVAKAELAWLELLLLPSADAGRSVVHRRYQLESEEAQKASERAALLAPNDVEVARLVLDTKRILGDLAAAQRLRSSVDSVAAEPETQLSLGALELLGPDLAPGALSKLEKAAAGEKQAGRGRSLYIYALARASDAKRARVELDELAKLARPHPLEAALRRFVERVEKGEKIAFRSSDVPTPKASEAPSVDVSAPLKAAEDALARRDSKKAEALFQQVLNADPENADALVGLAQIAKQTGNGKQALVYLERAVNKNPEHPKALLALADAKWDGGEANLARPLYKRALDAGLTGAAVERAKTRSTAAAVTTGGTTPPDTTPPDVPTAPPTATTEPVPTSTTPPPFGQDPPPFGQDPPPPPAPKDPPPPAPTNTVPGAPL